MLPHLYDLRMKPDIYKTVYITFAVCAAGLALGWMPALAFEMTAIFALGILIHQWRARIAHRKAESFDEEVSVSLFAPELIDMHGDFMAQACYVLQEIECFKARRTPEENALLDERLAAARDAYRQGNKGGNPKPWVHIAVLRQCELDIDNAKASTTKEGSTRSAARAPESSTHPRGPAGAGHHGGAKWNPSQHQDRRRKPQVGRNAPSRCGPDSPTGE